MCTCEQALAAAVATARATAAGPPARAALAVAARPAMTRWAQIDSLEQIPVQTPPITVLLALYIAPNTSLCSLSQGANLHATSSGNEDSGHPNLGVPAPSLSDGLTADTLGVQAAPAPLQSSVWRIEMEADGLAIMPRIVLYAQSCP